MIWGQAMHILCGIMADHMHHQQCTSGCGKGRGEAVAVGGRSTHIFTFMTLFAMRIRKGAHRMSSLIRALCARLPCSGNHAGLAPGLCHAASLPCAPRSSPSAAAQDILREAALMRKLRSQ